MTGIRSSLVQLEATADEMRFIVNTSPGKILGEGRGQAQQLRLHLHRQLIREDAM